MLYGIVAFVIVFGTIRGVHKTVDGVKKVERKVLRVITRPFHHKKPGK